MVLPREEKVRMFVGRFLRDASGATFIDYSLIATAISLVILAAVFVIGSDIENPFNSLTAALTGGSVQR